jgi:hypothetical protein
MSTTLWAAKASKTPQKGPQKCFKVLYMGRIIQNQVIENDLIYLFMFLIPLLVLKIVLIIQNYVKNK